jgi:hypothetical protein
MLPPRIGRNVQPLKLAEPLTELGDLSRHQRHRAAGKPQQLHRFEGHDAKRKAATLAASSEKKAPASGG